MPSSDYIHSSISQTFLFVSVSVYLTHVYEWQCCLVFSRCHVCLSDNIMWCVVCIREWVLYGILSVYDSDSVVRCVDSVFCIWMTVCGVTEWSNVWLIWFYISCLFVCWYVTFHCIVVCNRPVCFPLFLLTYNSRLWVNKLVLSKAVIHSNDIFLN